MTTNIAPRKFFYNDKELSDPNINWSPSKVLDFYATDMAELTTATIDNGDFKDGFIIFKFETKIGTKG